MKNILLSLLIIFTINSCSLNDDVLESKISAEIIEKKELNLSNFNDFDWDSLIILQPYSIIEKIENEKKIDLSNVSKSIESLDDINLIIFLKDKKTVKSCELKRNFRDFTGFYNQIISKEKANFILIGDLFPKNPTKLKLK